MQKSNICHNFFYCSDYDEISVKMLKSQFESRLGSLTKCLGILHSWYGWTGYPVTGLSGSGLANLNWIALDRPR